MIKIFQLLIHQVLDSVELNEKTFRDRGYRILWDKLELKEIKQEMRQCE